MHWIVLEQLKFHLNTIFRITNSPDTGIFRIPASIVPLNQDPAQTTIYFSSACNFLLCGLEVTSPESSFMEYWFLCGWRKFHQNIMNSWNSPIVLFWPKINWKHEMVFSSPCIGIPGRKSQGNYHFSTVRSVTNTRKVGKGPNFRWDVSSPGFHLQCLESHRIRRLRSFAETMTIHLNGTSCLAISVEFG